MVVPMEMQWVVMLAYSMAAMLAYMSVALKADPMDHQSAAAMAARTAD